MSRFTPGVAGGLAVGIAAAVATIFTFATSTQSAGPVKADRLPTNVSASPDEKRIAVVEVVGVRDAAIVYRDREGRILFRTDPVANMTVVTKNLVLPEVTIRETTQSQIERVPIEKTRTPGSDKQQPLQGCDTGLSPDISPTVPTGKDRCVVELAPRSGVASLQ
ncbi:MAG TPA: hypothetical protein VKT73_15885 [Xanthobacteraceae bacterium]|nr:hypothetical protein [Xanthobacteraceae bacterium]